MEKKKQKHKTSWDVSSLETHELGKQSHYNADDAERPDAAGKHTQPETNKQETHTDGPRGDCLRRKEIMVTLGAVPV